MRFKINPRVIEQLGKELITSDEVAINELLKNAYDANAKEVQVHFINNLELLSDKNLIAPVHNEIVPTVSNFMVDSRIIIIEDTGNGMGLNELEEGFFTVGTDLKKKQKDNSLFDSRAPLGEKGIGRLAAQRLSKQLFIETTNSESDETFLIRVDWGEFLNNSELQDLELQQWNFPKMKESYTRLWLINPNVEFEKFFNMDKQLSLFEDEDNEPHLKEAFQSSLSFLVSPFAEKEEEFTITIWLDTEKIPSQFQNESTKVAETEHFFKLDLINGELRLDLGMTLKPWYLERIHEILVPKDLIESVKKPHTYYEGLLKKYNKRYESSLKTVISDRKLTDDLKRSLEPNTVEQIKRLLDLTPIEGKVYSFKRDQKLSKMALDSARANNLVRNKNFNVNKLRSFLNYHNGIKLYRGKFRITTLGDKDNDWLELQQARTKGQQFFRFELGNSIGYVNINDPIQKYIQEISSRLDLMQNDHSKVLREFLKVVFHKYFYDFSRSAYYISEDILKEEDLIPKRSIEQLKEEVNESSKVALENKEYLKVFNEHLSIVSKNIDLDSQEKIDSVKDAFSSLFRTSEYINKNIENAIVSSQKTNEFLLRFEEERKVIELEAYNNYKLMANGLITEVITHELHSILSNLDSEEKTDDHFLAIENYILKIAKEVDLYTDHFRPLRTRFSFINSKMLEMNHFYLFLEKTFLYKGTFEDFQLEDVKFFLSDLENRLLKRLKKNKVDIDYSSIDLFWKVPRGALIHVFYNLIDNSIYWIGQRQIRSKDDKYFASTTRDNIEISKLDDNTILYSDSGTGVFPKYEHTLFHPLTTGKEANGRGMGLYIVKKLLNSFGADIELLPEKNQYGHRYIFAIYLQNEDQTSEREELNVGE